VNDQKSIKTVITSIKARRSKWHLSHRTKNLLTLSAIGLVEKTALDEIFMTISWKDYSAGPLADDHHPPIPGDIWIFGLQISERECYLKFQDRPNQTVIWISLHIAEHPLQYPFR